jgi:hypothetical protein
LSSTTATPYDAQISSTSARRSTASVTPAGLWKFGIVYRNFGVIPSAASDRSASRSRSGTSPCSSIATCTTRAWYAAKLPSAPT